MVLSCLFVLGVGGVSSSAALPVTDECVLLNAIPSGLMAYAPNRPSGVLCIVNFRSNYRRSKMTLYIG